MKKIITIILIMVLSLILITVMGIVLKLYLDGKDFDKGDLYIFYSNGIGLHSEIVSYDKKTLNTKGVKYYNFNGLQTGPKNIIVDKDRIMIAPVGDQINSDYRKILSINFWLSPSEVLTSERNFKALDIIFSLK